MQKDVKATAELGLTWAHTDVRSRPMNPGAATDLVLWDDAEELLAALEAGRREGRLGRGGQHAFGDPSWCGRDLRGGWEALFKAAREPWEEGLDLVERFQDELARVELPAPLSNRRRLLWDEDEGEEYDLTRDRAGEAPWRRVQRRRLSGPQVVTVAVNPGASCMMAPEDLAWRPAAALALAAVLEAAGYRAEILVAHPSTQSDSHGGRNLIHGVWCKRAQDGLDLATLVNVTAPWFVRTAWFTDMNLQYGPRGASDCYGYPALLTGAAVAALDPGCREVWVVDDALSFDDAVRVAAGFLKRLAEGRAA